ncbi:MAG TPA: lytic transglycosylase domain-containing protein, partial [Polyangiaceae bacterium]
MIASSKSKRWIVAVGLAALASLPLVATGRIERSTDQFGVITLGQTRAPRQSRARTTVPNESPSNALSSIRSSEASDRYAVHIREASRLYQIPEELIRAVIAVESGFSPRAVSPANAKGLMQLLPATAQRMQVEDIFDPRQNIYGGVRYLRILANLFNGDLNLTIAAYNAGEGAVLRYGGIPPYHETEDYVTRV